MKALIIALTLALLPAFVIACNDDGGTTTAPVANDEALPDDFPVFEGLEFDGGGVTGDDASSTFVGAWTTDASADEVRRFYEDQLQNGPWRIVDESETPNGTVIRVEREGGDEPETGVIVIREEDGKTIVGKEVTKGIPKVNTGDDEDDDDGGATGGSTPGPQPTPGSVSGLPADFPADRVPLPADATVETATGPSENAPGLFLVDFRSTSEPAALKTYWSATLTARGWTATGDLGGATNYTLTFTAGDDRLSVSAGASSTGSIGSITLQLGD